MTTMQATVIYPNRYVFLVTIPEDINFVRDVLAFLWDTCEPDGGNPTIDNYRKRGLRMRSAMVGDLYIVNGRYFMANSSGFVELDEIQFLKAQELTDSDRLMGWKWLEERCGLGCPIQIID